MIATSDFILGNTMSPGCDSIVHTLHINLRIVRHNKYCVDLIPGVFCTLEKLQISVSGQNGLKSKVHPRVQKCIADQLSLLSRFQVGASLLPLDLVGVDIQADDW